VGFRQDNIYVQNFVRSRHYDFDESKSALIGRLLAVESSATLRESHDGVARDFLEAFRGDSLYGQIDRFCLVQRVAHANELKVCDSALSPGLPDNLMATGYRCFVRPQSTLLQLREGEVRIYSEAQAVADTFHRKSHPVQRSLGLIMKMGLSSGITMPLHSGRHIVGFVFMNSRQSALFSSLEDADYAVLNLIGVTAKALLSLDAVREISVDEFARAHPARFTSALFDQAELIQAINEFSRWWTGELWNPKIQMTGDADFLVSPGVLAAVLTKVAVDMARLSELRTRVISIQSRDREWIDISLKADDPRLMPSEPEQWKRLVLDWGRTTRPFGYELHATPAGVLIRLPFDEFYAAGSDIFYSV
jgi:hypothetical protein